MSESVLINLILGMAPLKSLDIITKIIKKLPERQRKTLLKKLDCGYGLTPEVKKKLGTLDRIKKLLK